MNKELTIGELHRIYQKYGDLGIKVNTPYGYKDITWCGITEKNADVYRCELENGMFVEGADLHKLKNGKDEFINLNVLQNGEIIQTITGNSPVKSVVLLDEKADMYDIQVDEVAQYYANGIVSHNTTLTVDLLLFLFFGSTTKTDKNEEIFNIYTDSNLVEVKGKIEIEGETFIIKRTITRTKSRDGSYTCKGGVDFYQMLPKGGIKQLNGEQRKFTDDLIKNYVGTYDDFLITILTTGDNLEDLIRTKPTERGRILTRFIGLEYFREKEKIAIKKHADWKKTSKLNSNNSQDVLKNIELKGKAIQENNAILVDLFSRLNELKHTIIKQNQESENLFKTRSNDIDVELYKSNEDDIRSGIQKLEKSIEDKKIAIKNLIEAMPLPEKEYNIDLYGVLKNKLKEYNEKEITLRIEISGINKVIDMLKNSEICQTCNRPLDTVDNSSEIEKNNKLLVIKTSEWNDIKNILKDTIDKIEKLDIIKSDWDAYNRNELLIDKNKVELSSYQASLVRGQEKLERYLNIKLMVENNKIIDTDIQRIKFGLKTLNEERDLLSLQINGIERDITTTKELIESYNTLLIQLKNEEKIEHIFKTYLDIYGKNGISKMVLSTMIPLINNHLKILLSDSSEFSLELRMNEKSEVGFWMTDQMTGIEKSLNSGSGYEKTISSLALRCVLSKVCSLPKPNIIVFDEVTGKVANENLEKVGLFFDKLKQYFDHIWIISHNPIIQDWADYRVNVHKENNISKINYTI